MIKIKHLAAMAILSSAIANHVLAREVIEEPGVQSKDSRSANQGIGSPGSSERFIGTLENSTVWLAPVGHRQPRAADIPKSAPDPKGIRRALMGKMHSLIAGSAFAAEC